MNKSLNLRNRIGTDPDICHGKPCIRGTRYLVEIISELLSAGMSFEEILTDYADLEYADLVAVLEFTNRLNIPKERDKSSLLDLSVWTEEDIKEIEEGQRRLNAWPIPEMPDSAHSVDFFARRAIEEANRIWDQQGLSAETMDEWLTEDKFNVVLVS